MLKFVREKWKLGLVLCLAASIVMLFSPIGVSTSPQSVSTSILEIGQERFELTIGTKAHAAAIIDYVCDGANDDVQFQQALDALPATGGKITVLAGDYTFGAVVTRPINNITIEGVGRATNLTRDAINPIFSAGVQSNWVFRDLRFDAGGINLATATNYILENVSIGTGYFAYRTDDTTGVTEWPTGRSTTLTVAGVGATAISQAQADYVCNGTNDEVEIQAAVNALPAQGGKILMVGTFDLEATITAGSLVAFEGVGRVRLDVQTLDGIVFDISEAASTPWCNTKTLSNFYFFGAIANANTMCLRLTNIHTCEIENIASSECSYFALVRGAAFSNVFRDVHPVNGIVGIQIDTFGGFAPNNTRVESSSFHDFSTAAVWIADGYQCKVSGCYFEANTVCVDAGSGAGNPYGPLITGNNFALGTNDIGVDVNVHKVTIANNHFETNADGVYGIRVTGAYIVIIDGNSVDFEDAGVLKSTFIYFTSANARGTISNNNIRYALNFMATSGAFTEFLSVTGNYAYQVFQFSATSVYLTGTVTGNHIEDNMTGVFVGTAQNCIVSNNRVTNATNANALRSLGGCTFRNNQLIGCTKPIVNAADIFLEVFIPYPEPNGNIGDHPALVLTDAADTTGRMEFKVPTDWATFNGFEIIVVPGGTGNMRWSVDTDWGIPGTDAYNTNSDAIAAGEVAVTQNKLETIAIHAAWTGGAADNLIGITFVRVGTHVNDTVNANCYLLGVRMIYIN